ncbi:MAG: rhamnogalacturonan acetylesterase [Victivallaceae bacterium]
MKRLLILAVLAGGLLAGAAELAVQNLNFADGLKGWQNAYPKTMAAEAVPGGVKLTVLEANPAPGALVQNLKVPPETDLVFSAKVDCDKPGVAYLHIKVNKGGKQFKVYDSNVNAKGVSELKVRFNTGDCESISILCRMKAAADTVGASAVFTGLALVEPAGNKFLLAGDSTVANYAPTTPTVGWGQVLAGNLKSGVEVINLAVGGRSTKSFIDEKRWDNLLAQVKPGDVVLIQFGHNDQKKDKPEVYADAETDYRTNLKRFIADVRAKQGKVILCTPVSRRMQDAAGKVKPTLGAYPDAVRAVGQETDTPVIDLTVFTAGLYEKLGVEESRKLFNGVVSPSGQEDYTHYGKNGAELVSREVTRQIKERNLPGAEWVQ